MNMKIVKKSLRVWITVASVFSFLGGWILFSHSGKPAPLQINQPVISAPSSNSTFQQFSRNSQSSGFPFSSQSQSRSFGPRLRTGGS
jgi:hypothetical protein